MNEIRTLMEKFWNLKMLNWLAIDSDGLDFSSTDNLA